LQRASKNKSNIPQIDLDSEEKNTTTNFSSVNKIEKLSNFSHLKENNPPDNKTTISISKISPEINKNPITQPIRKHTTKKSPLKSGTT
jgi:hypothetical protein